MNNITIIAILVGVVGFFLRDLHTRLKQAENDIKKGHDATIELKSEMIWLVVYCMKMSFFCLANIRQNYLFPL